MASHPPLGRDEFNKLFLSALPMLYNLAMRIFRSEEEASDFLQDFYIFAEKKRHNFAGLSRFSTWLYRLAIHEALAALRRKRKISWEILDETQIESHHLGPEELEHRQDLEKKVQEEFLKLPDTYRIPLYLRYYENMSYEEIAQTLNLKEGTLKSLIFRGKQILKEKLIKGGIYEPVK
ncbi:MAG: sigma-70 family RNA polymerase sigma factor [Leptospiraceae bacterium]|nr:sigma-70 family RNA polymerase sigma factor [Leptospiraceae bacterium]MDW8306138.1 sigma-70 family RNA polymerase sigma factor [Leptospiraceae bacterium]